MHLLLPLTASLLFVGGLILIKRAGAAGVGAVTTLFVANEAAAIAFSLLWLLGGAGQPWTLLWQPAIIAGLFMAGLMFTFAAIHRGDVSVAAPVFGVKVVFVAILLTLTGEESLPAAAWYAAVLATVGIGLIQWTGQGQRRHVVLTILLALSAATCYATFDVLVQRWAPAWGAGRFLPIVYAFVAVLSLGMLPWVDWSTVRTAGARRSLLFGAVLFAMQSLCIVLAVAEFGDAARINVVYALRGLWGVALAWLIAKKWGGAEAELDRSMLLLRRVLLTAAVILA